MDNVKNKVSDTATRAKEAVVGTASWAGDAMSETTSRVGDAAPSGGQVKQQAKRAVGLAQENPLGLAVGAVALGFLVGLAVPSTRVENERLGPVADQVKDKVRETGQEALDRGKQVAQEVAGSAAETAEQSAQEQSQDLAQGAKQNAQDLDAQTRRRTRASTTAGHLAWPGSKWHPAPAMPSSRHVSLAHRSSTTGSSTTGQGPSVIGRPPGAKESTLCDLDESSSALWVVGRAVC